MPLSGHEYPYEEAFGLESVDGITINEEGEIVPAYLPQADDLLLAGDARTIEKQDGRPVSESADTSENDRPLTVSNESREPSYQESAIGSLPAIRFDGSNDYLAYNFDNNYQQPYHVVIAFRLRHLPYQNNGQRYVFSCNGSNVKFGINSDNRHSSTQNVVQWNFRGGGTMTGGNNHGEPHKEFAIANACFAGEDSYLRINGTQIVAGNAGNTELSKFCIGGNTNSSNAQVDVLEYAVYNSDVRDWNNEIEAYFDRSTNIL
jgi:hypothetical protein